MPDEQDGGAEERSITCQVRGRVQGVGFRYFICEQAQQLRLRGYVRNRPDRSVEIVASGPEDRLRELEKVARQGPYGARVASCDVTWGTAIPEFGAGPSFRIRY